MITWLQSFLQRHHKIFFGSLLAVIIVAFVFTFGPSGGFQKSGQGLKRKDFFGKNLAAQKDVQNMLLGAEIAFWVNNGFPLRDQNQLQDFALARTAALHQADINAIPLPDEDQFRAFLETKRVFQEADGKFSHAKFIDFRDTITASPQFTEALVTQILRDEYRIDEVKSILAGPAYLSSSEVIKELEKDETRWGVEVASLDYNEFKPEVTPEETDLKSFYEENPARYEEPEKVLVELIKFSAANFTTAKGFVPPSEMELEEHFNKNKWRYKKPENQENADETPVETNPALAEEVTLNDVREEVTKDVVQAKASRLAAEEADSLAYRFYREEIKRGSEAFKTVLEEAGAEVIAVEPFSRNRPPFNLGVPWAVLMSTFDLTDSRYWSDIAEMRDGAGIIIYKGKEPSRIPAFEDVQAKVEVAYKEEERKRLFTEKGEEIKTALEAVLKDGKTFKEAAEEAGLKVETYDDFAGKEPPREFNSTLFTHGKNLDVGRVSPMVLQGQTGKFVFLKNRDVPDLKDSKDELKNKRKQLADIMVAQKSVSIIAELTMRELEKTTPEPETADNADESEGESDS